MAKEVVFDAEEKAVLRAALESAVSSAKRSAAKSGLELVKQAYLKQAEVLARVRGKVEVL